MVEACKMRCWRIECIPQEGMVYPGALVADDRLMCCFLSMFGFCYTN